MTIREHIQRLSLGAEIILFEIDLTMFDQGIIYITPSSDNGSVVSFGGESYAPHPVEAEGYEATVDGPMPRPSITIGNIDGALTPLVEQHDDLQGAIVRRIVTYERYLDSGDDPDGNAMKPVDVHQISRKTGDDGDTMSFELTALMDQEGVSLPARKMARDYCSHDYRIWDAATETFDYSGATCPYAGDDSFDENDDPVADALDRCSKRLSGCTARFGIDAALPTRAFPGLSRVRAR